MELLWYSNKTDNKSKPYTEIPVDTGILTNPVFYGAPYALGTEFGGINEEAMENVLLPEPDGENSNKKGKDTTSLRLGERGIINPLWQYTEIADPRTCGSSGENYGRVYNTTIRPNNPIVFIQPGKPKFHTGGNFFSHNSKDMDKIKSALLDKDLHESAAGMNFGVSDLLEALKPMSSDKANPQKFYDFQPNWKMYKTYVRALCDELMVRMGIDKEYNEQYKLYGKDAADILTRFTKYYGFLHNAGSTGKSGEDLESAFLPFRVEKTTDAGDSFNNSTGESSIASQIKGNEYIEKAKEASFLLGRGEDNVGVLGKAVGGLFNAGANLAGSINDNAEAIIKSGGNLLFPEVWKESTMSKSLSINIKLHSPYADPICYYENVIFPLACLLCLALPEQAGSSVYTSPPLVRVRSRGWFSCDMGMVESISIKRGQDKNDWTNRRLPRTVEVTLNIKDLFGTMMLSLMGKAGLSSYSENIFAVNNTALRDYLNVIGGIDTFSEARFGTKLSEAWNATLLSFKRLADPKAVLYSVGSNAVSRVPLLGSITKNWFPN